MKKIAAACLFALLITIPSRGFAGVFVSVAVAPPPLVVYDQPIVPGPDYIWMPGYWAYDEDGWYWVPGAWVLPPEPGLLWTPGYWEWDDYGHSYYWHAGYWGPHVGFYGGVAYGYGYPGYGYYGGYWDHGVFWYNRSCTHIDHVVIHNTYEKVVIVDKTRVHDFSYNGGPGRQKFLATHAELEIAKEHHWQPTALQVKHQNFAMASRETHFSVNHGKPFVAATLKAGEFDGKGAVRAKGWGSPGNFSTQSAHTDSLVHGDGPGHDQMIKPGDRKFGADKFGARRGPHMNDRDVRLGETGRSLHGGPYGQHDKGDGQGRETHRRRPPNQLYDRRM